MNNMRCNKKCDIIIKMINYIAIDVMDLPWLGLYGVLVRSKLKAGMGI